MKCLLFSKYKVHFMQEGMHSGKEGRRWKTRAVHMELTHWEVPSSLIL